MHNGSIVRVGHCNNLIRVKLQFLYGQFTLLVRLFQQQQKNMLLFRCLFGNNVLADHLSWRRGGRHPRKRHCCVVKHNVPAQLQPVQAERDGLELARRYRFADLKKRE